MAHRGLKTTGVVYFLLAPSVGRIKIGFSTGLKKRMAELQMNCPVELRLLTWVYASRVVENVLLKIFGKYRLHGEWFVAHDDIIEFANKLEIAGHLSLEEILKK